MPLYAYLIILAGIIIWFTPFALAFRKGGEAFKVDRRARWGVVLECVAFSLLWQGSFWTRVPKGWESGSAVVLFALGCVISWSAARALGKQFRVEAAISQDHELVRSGPYRYVRHPIYSSMLCVLLGTGLIIASWILLALAVVVFCLGTLIRIRIEDRLLAESFASQFEGYRREVAALIPFVL